MLGSFQFFTQLDSFLTLRLKERSQPFGFPHPVFIYCGSVSLTLLLSLLKKPFSGSQFVQALLSRLFQGNPVFIKLLPETLCRKPFLCELGPVLFSQGFLPLKLTPVDIELLDILFEDCFLLIQLLNRFLEPVPVSIKFFCGSVKGSAVFRKLAHQFI